MIYEIATVNAPYKVILLIQDFEQPQLLQGIPLRINSEVGLIICDQCKIGILPVKSNIVAHSKKHSVRIDLSTIDTSIEFFPIIDIDEVRKMIKPTRDKLHPIKGIPIGKGFYCSLCADNDSSTTQAYCCLKLSV